ncbi:hypothetical protein FUA23_09695 [Neolewinella aurantiaca]|uniref:SbsA Ig-like domain-containing protein n=1 Tax=Neolewinella aurantiaca TaxID=2602767 RepID=A0A5C7FIS8_9BACT|nr:carboxypeptidase-like regulatory domain-containing protein [Neolewinella aurantiaca]TXF89711.1 hypothetical protein FUA23_09695 [Neolewinella aurantiaca]
MTRSLLAIAGLLLVLIAQMFTLQHCATPSSPTGGPRDTIGPVLIPEETTPNFQTNFRPEEIVLTFDEWVEQDAKQQIIISPPLELGEDNQPFLRRRSLVIPLKGLTLRDSVTYVVNIGSAIKDLNEGNPTENLRFVFATGPVLDSATVTGTLVEDFSGEPINGATFTLYDNLADTAALTENPTYFAQTDEDGKFTVFNIRPGQYRAVGLIRNPGATNYFADFTGTFKPLSVGFIDTVITVIDGNTDVGSIRLSPVPTPTKVIGLDTSTLGKIAITMNQTAENIDLLTSRTDYLRYNDKDTIKLFYREAGADTIFVGRDSLYSDTIVVASTGSLTGKPLDVVTGPKQRVFAGAGPTFIFNQPVQSVDTSLISLRKDTFPESVPFSFVIDTTYPGEVAFRSSWDLKLPYSLDILPGALTSWSGSQNQDTISRRFSFDGAEKFGILTVKINNLDPTADYILRLLEKDKVVFATRRYISKQFDYTARFDGLSPGTYKVEILYDSNRNQRYDSGDLRFGRQPELVRRFEIPALRADWEVEETIDLK